MNAYIWELPAFEVQDDGCWRFLTTTRGASISGWGYGQIKTPSGKRVMAHRVMYEQLVGAIPEGLVLDHLCNNTLCINPHHCKPVTQRENVLRSEIAVCALNARKTHCPRNHPLSGDNLVLTQLRNGRDGRGCRECNNRSAREYRERQRASKGAAA